MKKTIKLVAAFAMVLALTACGKSTTLRYGRASYAAHGTKSFAVTDVVLSDDKILAVHIDEYQFIAADAVEETPNGVSMITGVYADAKVALASKRLNNTYYSGNMATKGGATKALEDGYKAIEGYVTGKTIAELEAAIKDKDAEAVVDADIVAGCTLVDTLGYIESVIEAAKVAEKTAGVKYSGDTSKVVLSRAEYAAHGTKSFAITSTVTDGEKILVAYIDEIQFIAADAVEGVPNSKSMMDGVSDTITAAIAFKRVNNEYYSGNMATKGGATKKLDEGYVAIEGYVTGKTVAELEAAIKDKDSEAVIDADIVAGCTLEDTLGYIESVIAAAK